MTTVGPRSNDDDHAGVGDPQSADPNPRAFAIGTGVVLQTVGTILALGSCCLWSTSSLYMRPAGAPADRWRDFFFADPVAAGWTVGVLTSFVGGIGLIAAGVGLQGERPGSGRFAMGVTGGMAAVFALLAGWLIVAEKAYGLAVMPAVLAGVCGFLFALCGHSASVLRRFPPPADLSRATPEILEEYRRKREQRIREMD
jgi:hypothetical protein